MKIPEVRPMSEAPRDGRVIIAISRDLSLIEAIRWGEHVDQKELDETWFSADFTEQASGDDGYLGWIPAPNLRWHKSDRPKVEMPWGTVVSIEGAAA